MMAVPFPWTVYRPQRVDLEGAYSDDARSGNNVGFVYGAAVIHDGQLLLAITDHRFPLFLTDILQPEETFEAILGGGE